MKKADDDIELYKLLASRARDMKINVPASHKTLFQPTADTAKYYQELYLDQVKSGSDPRRRPGDATCSYCEKFHLGNLKNINKNADINLGKDLERCFQEFFEKQLDECGVHVTCERADQDNFHMPDFKIVRCRDGRVLGYFEFKVIFRPFIMISKKVNPSFECYSNSLTLDLSNGMKLLEQRKLVVKDIGVENVEYVYWYDLPCVKGVFWLTAEQVYRIMDNSIPFDRQVVPGDYTIYGKKHAATRKLYLPLLEMSDISSLLDMYIGRAKEFN